MLDTNVVSELRRVRAGKADPRVASWAAGLSGNDLFLSSIVVHELELGVLLAERCDPATERILRAWLDGQVLRLFAGRVLDVDIAVARRAASLNVPDPRPFRNCLIAATSLVHGMTVATRNVADFVRLRVAVFNPWAD